MNPIPSTGVRQLREFKKFAQELSSQTPETATKYSEVTLRAMETRCKSHWLRHLDLVNNPWLGPIVGCFAMLCISGILTEDLKAPLVVVCALAGTGGFILGVLAEVFLRPLAKLVLSLAGLDFVQRIQMELEHLPQTRKTRDWIAHCVLESPSAAGYWKEVVRAERTPRALDAAILQSLRQVDLRRPAVL